MNVLKGFVVERRRSMMWWALGIVGLVVFTVSLYPTIKTQPEFAEVFENLPESLRAFVGAQEGIPITSAAGYLHTRIFSTFLPLLLLVFGIGLGARAIGGSEDDGTLELLLTKPVSRLRVAGERLLAVATLTVALAAVFAVALIALAPAFELTESTSSVDMGIATAAVTVLTLVHTSIAFAIGLAVGRRGPALGVAGAIAGGGYVINALASLSDAVRPLRYVSPWHWALSSNPLVDGPSVASYLVLVLVAVIAVVLGTWRFLSRDLS